MTTQYAYENLYTPELDYQAEELTKRLKYSMANFAHARFICSVKMRISLTEKTE